MTDQPTQNRENVLISLFVASTFCFFNTTAFFFTNKYEFSANYVGIFPRLLLVTAAVTAALFALLRYVRKPVLAPLLTALGVMIWVQSNLLVWNYGQFNGVPINWSSKTFNGVLELAVWGAVFGGAWFRREWVRARAVSISIFFILLQSLSCVYYAVKSPDNINPERMIVAEQDNFVFSKNKNTIILILDGFRSDIFEKIIDEKPEYKSLFDGFTYYRNMSGVFPTTFPSVPAILTGQAYDSSLPMPEFIRKAYYGEGSALHRFKAEGWKVFVHSKTTMNPYLIYYSPEMFDNIVKLPISIFGQGAESLGVIRRNLFQHSMFRSSPHFIKQQIYNWWISPSSKANAVKKANKVSDSYMDTDTVTNKMFLGMTDPQEDKPVFYYIHLKGAHPPITLNENAEYEEMKEYSPDNYVKQAKGALKIASNLIAGLKAKGIYDKTMLVIMADHGWDIANPLLGEEEGFSPLPKARLKAALPMMMIKPYGSKGAFKISDLPVSSLDISRTVLTANGIPAQTGGYDILSDRIPADRKRIFKYFTFSEQHVFNGKQLPPTTVYEIAGPVRKASSWRETGVENPDSDNFKPLPAGGDISFGSGGNSTPYLTEGWVGPENNGNWMNGTTAALWFHLPYRISDLELTMNLVPLTAPGKLERQTLEVYIQNSKVGEFQVRQEGVYSTIIPSKFLTGPDIKMYLYVPSAQSPASLGLWDYKDKLGIFVKQIKIAPLTPMTGIRQTFSAHGSGTKYLKDGWLPPEETGAWSTGHSSMVQYPWQAVSGATAVETCGIPMTDSQKLPKQDIMVKINGKPAGSASLSEEGCFTVKIPQIPPAPAMSITYELPKSISPKKLGKWNFDAPLGIYIKSLTLK